MRPFWWFWCWPPNFQLRYWWKYKSATALDWASEFDWALQLIRWHFHKHWGVWAGGTKYSRLLSQCCFSGCYLARGLFTKRKFLDLPWLDEGQDWRNLEPVPIPIFWYRLTITDLKAVPVDPSEEIIRNSLRLIFIFN